MTKEQDKKDMDMLESRPFKMTGGRISINKDNPTKFDISAGEINGVNIPGQKGLDVQFDSTIYIIDPQGNLVKAGEIRKVRWYERIKIFIQRIVKLIKTK